jgi:2-iminobutanoate/2-iminopropanoate deaminase
MAVQSTPLLPPSSFQLKNQGSNDFGLTMQYAPADRMREVVAAPLPGLDLRQHYGHHQSPAIRAGGLIFCSGMLPVDPHTAERLHGTLTSEAHVIFGNLKLLLESAGSSLDRLVQVHALIYDSIEYDVLNRVYRQYVANGPPARTVWTAQIEAGFKVQLDVIAAA